MAAHLQASNTAMSAMAESSTSTSGGSQTANPPFEQALARSLEGLPQEDREAFQSSTAEDIIAAVEQLNSEHEAQSRGRRYLERFTGIVSPLREYFDVITTATESIPAAQLGGVVWGALLFMIQVL